MLLRPIRNPGTAPEAFSLSEAFKRNTVVHLVIDIQRLYCDPSNQFAIDTGMDFSKQHEVAFKIKDFISHSRDRLAPVWIVQGKEYIGKMGSYGPMAIDAGHDDPRGFALANLYNQAVLDEDAIFLKPEMDAFKNPELAPYLREQGIEAVMISGVQLHACVRKTGLSAASNGFQTYILEDLVAHGVQMPQELRAGIDRFSLEWGSLTSAQALAL